MPLDLIFVPKTSVGSDLSVSYDVYIKIKISINY